MASSLLDRLIQTCLHHPRRVLAFWVLLAVVAAFGAQRVQSVLDSDQEVAGSESAQVAARLRTEFRQPFTFPAYVVLSGLPEGDRQAAGNLVRRIEGRLAACSDVQATVSPLNIGGTMLGTPGHGSVMIITGLKADSEAAARAAIPPVRQVLRDVMVAARTQAPGLQAAVTGEQALNVDMIEAMAQDAAAAEARAIPVTLLLLLVVFGSLPAAGLPLLVGMLGTLITLGCIYVVGQFGSLSSLVISIATLMGLGVGTDAGLFLVARYREERAAGREVPEAVAIAMRTVGMAVTGSSLTVMIGFGAMLTVPVAAIRSIGVGGLIEVAMCTAVAVTAVPAAIVLLGDRLDWPTGMGRFLRRWQMPNLWARWAKVVMARPLLSLAAGLLLLGTLALPTRHMQIGLPDLRWVPERLESVKGMIALDGLPQAPGLWSLHVLVDAPPGHTLLEPAAVDGLFALTSHLSSLPAVASVQSLIRPQAEIPEWQIRLLLTNPDQARQLYPDVFRLFVNESGTAARFLVTPVRQLAMADGIVLTDRIRALNLQELPGLSGAKLTVGGPLAGAVDLKAALLDPFPRLIAGVLAATGLMVLVLYRSLLLPLKALILNGLSVLATFGALVLVFQQGWGASWLGLDQKPIGVVIVAVPVLVFCIVFGLSMDYELLMLSRIRERYLQTADNSLATAEGLAATGGLITNAALIMGIAFGSFALAELITLKMLGFGLAVAVALDATVVRILLVPAVMRLAGRWNWWPGDRSRS
jgi:RND superfamily putative drug exporter